MPAVFVQSQAPSGGPAFTLKGPLQGGYIPTFPFTPDPTQGLNVTQQQGSNYGSDFSTYPDLDTGFYLQSGPIIVAWACMRRLDTQRGSMEFHTNDGLYLRGMLNKSFSASDLPRLQKQIEAEMRKDERVQSVTCALQFDANSGILTVSVSATTGEGPFIFSVAVTALTFSILKVAQS